MRALLDTHSFIWFIEGKPLLSAAARRIIEASDTDLFISVASIWEVAIKYSIRKLELSQPFDVLIPQQMREQDIVQFEITLDHLAHFTTLPFHHRDPFDRLLIAQVIAENLPIISVDAAFDAYGVTRLW